MIHRRAFGAFGGGVAIALALVSCGGRLLGTGVVLWSDGGPMATGAIVDVVEESTIEDRYLVRAASADRREEPLPVAPRWRVRVFAEPEQAAEFAARYAEFVDAYAYAARRGLPVRAEASATAGIVYKLREQEVIKVIERGAEPEQVGSFENYWYRVLTEDGTEGYTFGEFLPVFESFGDPRAEAARLQADDPGLERALATAWRPEEFLSMVNRRRFDLLRLRPEYGLFPDPEAGVFRLVTAQRERVFPYRAVERVGDGRYVLASAGGDGSPARFTLRGSGALAFSYVDEGRQITEVFVDLQDEVEELIAAEQERRARLFAALLERGPLLRSGGYGTIELTAEGRFRWQGYEALVPRWVPDGLPGTGVVDFRYALGAPLRGSYDVAVTLLFDAPERAAGGAAADSGAGASGAAGSGAAAGGARTVVAVPGRGTGADGQAVAPGGRAGTDAGVAGGAGRDSGVEAGGAAGAGAGSGPGAAPGTDAAGGGTPGAGAGSAGASGAAQDAAATAAPGTAGAGAGAGAGAAGAVDASAAEAGARESAAAGGGADGANPGAGEAGSAGATGGTGAARGGSAATTSTAGTGAEDPHGNAGTAVGAGADDRTGAGEEPLTAALDSEADGEAGRGPEYMRPIAWAAELTLLASYDAAGVRLTPAEPAAAGLVVREVNRSAVVMYFASSSAGGG